ncbi:MAG: DedA family protein [Nocardioidaceae bacterium]
MLSSGVTTAAVAGAVSISGVVAHFGLVAVFCFVALEAAGVPLPGETVLVLAAGFAGHTGHFSLLAVIAVAAGAAVIGDNLGYAFGRYGGWPLLQRFRRPLHIRDSDLKVGRLLFHRYGGRMVFFGRFVSILRTYAALLAGVNHMRWRQFLLWNGASGIIWATTWTTAAYVFGARLSGLSGGVQSGLLTAVGLLALGALILIRRRWVQLRTEAEAAYPDPLR